jgi:hypothetical protein
MFERLVYRFLRTGWYPNFFVGRSSLRSFMGQSDQHAELLVLFVIVQSHGHMDGHLSLEPLWLVYNFNINLSIAIYVMKMETLHRLK